jgi:hypothetical protein
VKRKRISSPQESASYFVKLAKQTSDPWLAKKKEPATGFLFILPPCCIACG